MLTKEVRVDGRLIGIIVDGAGLMLQSMEALRGVGVDRAARAIADAVAEIEGDSLVTGKGMVEGVGILRLVDEDLRRGADNMREMACVEIDLDPRPTVARAPAPVHLTPAMLRMDANSRKYQSTQKNWRRYDGTHFKKNKRIK